MCDQKSSKHILDNYDLAPSVRFLVDVSIVEHCTTNEKWFGGTLVFFVISYFYTLVLQTRLEIFDCHNLISCSQEMDIAHLCF